MLQRTHIRERWKAIFRSCRTYTRSVINRIPLKRKISREWEQVCFHYVVTRKFSEFTLSIITKKVGDHFLHREAPSKLRRTSLNPIKVLGLSGNKKVILSVSPKRDTNERFGPHIRCIKPTKSWRLPWFFIHSQRKPWILWNGSKENIFRKRRVMKVFW